jgi:hypothetical protein
MVKLTPGGSKEPDMFCNFYIVKNVKIALYSTTTEAGKNKNKFGILEVY